MISKVQSVSAPVSSDVDLLAAHNNGDPHAFAELFRRHKDRNASSFRGRSQVTTWLHRIVVNACLDRVRRQQARPTVPLPDSGPGEPAVTRDAIDERETRLAVQDALARLPADQRTAIVLIDVQVYSVAEAAQMLGVAPGTVKSRCARGRLKLAKLLRHLRNPSADANVPSNEKETWRREGR